MHDCGQCSKWYPVDWDAPELSASWVMYASTLTTYQYKTDWLQSCIMSTKVTRLLLHCRSCYSYTWKAPCYSVDWDAPELSASWLKYAVDVRWRFVGVSHAIRENFAQTHPVSTGRCPGFIWHMVVALPWVRLELESIHVVLSLCVR